MLNVGQILHDRFTVKRVLARGGMATVYIVEHTTLRSEYALKVLDLHSGDIRQRLLQEGRIQASLRHPNIVGVTDALDLAGQPALVMEYVEGPALSEVLADGPVPLDQALDWFRSIARAVDYAHQRGLVHRDLKPDNVLMAPLGNSYLPKVADFGIAKVVQDYMSTRVDGPHTRTGVGMGTPAYMPPEQMQNARGVDHRADIFALGCILYELVCGRRAFDSDNLLSLLNAVAEGDYPAPDSVVDHLPSGVIAAIHAALEPDPDLRVASCGELLALLDGGAQVPPPRRTLASQPPPEPRRRSVLPWLAAGTGGLLLAGGLLAGVLAIGGGAMWWHWNAAPSGSSSLPPLDKGPLVAPSPVARPAPVPAPAPVITQVEPKPVNASPTAFDITFHGWRTLEGSAMGRMQEMVEPGVVLVLVDATVRYDGAEADSGFFPWDLFLRDGEEIDGDLQCSLFIDNAINPFETYEPGAEVRGEVCFPAPGDRLDGARVQFKAMGDPSGFELPLD